MFMSLPSPRQFFPPKSSPIHSTEADPLPLGKKIVWAWRMHEVLTLQNNQFVKGRDLIEKPVSSLKQKTIIFFLETAIFWNHE